MKRHCSRLSTWLVVLPGAFMGGNTIRALFDLVGFASDMGLPLTGPANHAFVKVYALRAAFPSLCALGLLWLSDIRVLVVADSAGLLFQRARQEVNS